MRVEIYQLGPRDTQLFSQLLTLFAGCLKWRALHLQQNSISANYSARRLEFYRATWWQPEKVTHFTYPLKR
ncbi:MAG TPA: hypothetical protein VK658_18990 [Chryseolinea sp.]|nr:hypothetical protein [Chryseolinea sp.]